jgi:hypothetical protein
MHLKGFWIDNFLTENNFEERESELGGESAGPILQKIISLSLSLFHFLYDGNSTNNNYNN